MSGRSWRPMPQVGRVEVDADVRAELEAHLEMQIQELIQDGYAPEAARAEAQRRFGDRRLVEREVLRIDRKAEGERRRSRIMSDFMIDARIALRQLRRQPMFAFVAIAIMALGIGANAAVSW